MTRFKSHLKYFFTNFIFITELFMKKKYFQMVPSDRLIIRCSRIKVLHHIERKNNATHALSIVINMRKLRKKSKVSKESWFSRRDLTVVRKLVLNLNCQEVLNLN